MMSIIGNMIASQIDAKIYKVGRKGVMFRDIPGQPALVNGEAVKILRYKNVSDRYGPRPRVLVRTKGEVERWIAGSDVVFPDEPRTP